MNKHIINSKKPCGRCGKKRIYRSNRLCVYCQTNYLEKYRVSAKYKNEQFRKERMKMKNVQYEDFTGYMPDEVDYCLDRKINDKYDVSFHNKGCIALWRAVIECLLMDAQSKEKKKSKLRDSLNKHKVHSYIRKTNIDLQILCDMADFDTFYIVNRFNKIFDNNKLI